MNITEWGRVGYAGQSKTFASAGRAFMDSKIREKTGKGYRPQQVLSGSKPASVQMASASELAQLAKTQIVTNNPLVDQLMAQLVRANVHHILQSTTMQYDASKGTFSTPLGIVDQLAIDATRAILVQIGSYVQTSDYDSRSFMDNVNDYLMLVSQNIGMGRLDLCLSLPLKSYPIVRTRLVWRCRETCTRLLLAGSSPSAVLIKTMFYPEQSNLKQTQITSLKGLSKIKSFHAWRAVKTDATKARSPPSRTQCGTCRSGTLFFLKVPKYKSTRRVNLYSKCVG